MSLDKVFKLSVIVNMIDKITGPASKMNGGIDGNMKKLDQWEQKFNSLNRNGIQVAGMGAAVTASTLSLTKSTFETSKALGELASLGIEDFKALSDAGADFSSKWAGTSKAEFISAAYDIKSGISSLTDEGVAKYTEIAGMTAKATKSTVSEMTDLFATGYGIYKGYYSDLSDMEFAQVFGAGIAKSVQTFKTDGSKLAESISTLGASATTANVPLEEQLSILGMLQSTMGGSEAGTKYKAFLQSAASAGDKLGISFLDANNQLLSMPDIINSLRLKFGDTMDAAEKMKLTEAFGTEEAVSMIDLLYNKSGDLQGNIESLYTSMGSGTGLITEMADAINNTDPDKYALLGQQWQNLKEDLGTMLLPVMRQFMNTASSAIATISEWTQKHERLSAALVVALTGFGAVLTGIGIGMVVISSLGVVISSLIKTISGLNKVLSWTGKTMVKLKPMALSAGGAFKKMGLSMLAATKNAARGLVAMARQAIVTAATALPPLIASVWAFTTALLANPITWIVLAIAALIGIIVLLYQNWDRVTAFMKGAWTGFCSGIMVGVNFVKSGFMAIVSFITGKLEWFRTAGGRIVSTLVEGIRSVAGKPIEAVRAIFTKLRKLLPFSDAKEGPLSDLTLSGQRVFTTMVSGMEKVEHLPAEQAEKSFGAFNEVGKKEVKKVNISKSTTETTTEKKDSGSKGTVIEKLILQADINKLKDLKALFKLIEELEDLDNSSDNPDGAYA